ncbi:MAG: YitT family protein [Mailhella sp.]|nr:YitT family protein [Mailhella sp.]
MRFNWKQDSKTLLMVIIAAAIMAVNINTFVQTGGLYPGGVTGLTLLIQRFGEAFFGVHLPFAAVNFLLNLFPIYIGFRFIGKKFTMYSCLMIGLTALLIDIIPPHIVTEDVLLISVFGGIINGIAVSMCLRSDTTAGGTDFIAIYLAQKKNIDAWNLILAFNVAQLGVAGLLFGWDKALYSIIFQYVSTQVIQMMYKRFQKKTLFIVTTKPKEVCAAIFDKSHHGATILRGEGSFENQERSLVYSVVSSDESKRVMRAVRDVDGQAFINTFKTDELKGFFYQRPTE